MARRSARLSHGPPAWAIWKSSQQIVDGPVAGAHPFLLRLVDRRQAGHTGGGEGERQQYARRSRTSTRPSWISTSPRPSCPTCPIAPRWSLLHNCHRPAQPIRAIPTARRLLPMSSASPSATPAAIPACACLPDPRPPSCWHPSTQQARTAKPDGPSLESLIQFGWLGVIAKPLYIMLRFMVAHGHLKLGLGHHLVHGHLQPRSPAHALHDDQVVAQDDAHPAQG